MDQLTDIERLIAIEDIKQLKSRRDRAVDQKDWAVLEALHAPEHHSYVQGLDPWTSAREMIEKTSAALEGVVTVHHSHTPDITFQSATSATGIWAMVDHVFWNQGDEAHWLNGYGFYTDSYEKRDGRWVYVARKLSRLKVEVSPGGDLSKKTL